MGQANINDEKYNLLLEFGRLIEETHPDVISMENVPQIRETDVYREFIALLKRNHYHYNAQVVYCPNYGMQEKKILSGKMV